MMCTIHSWHPFLLLFHQPSIKHLDYCISWGQYWEPLSSPLTPPKPHWDVCAATRRQNQTIINLLWPKSRAQKFVNLNNFAAAVLQHHIYNIIIIYVLRVTLEFKKKKAYSLMWSIVANCAVLDLAFCHLLEQNCERIMCASVVTWKPCLSKMLTQK